MKDIHEVQDIQPRAFNHVHYRGVSAKARSVHLMDWKLSWKGDTPTTAPSCEAHWKSTNYSLDNTITCKTVNAISPHNETVMFLHACYNMASTVIIYQTRRDKLKIVYACMPIYGMLTENGIIQSIIASRSKVQVQ